VRDYLLRKIEFDEDLLNLVGSRISKVGNPNEEIFLIPVAASDLLEFIARELFRNAEFVAGRELPITEEDVVGAVQDLLLARVWYAAGGRAEVHPRDLVYPALFGPILAQVGVYHDEIDNITIVPVPETKEYLLHDEDGNVLGINRKKMLPRSTRLETVTKVLAAVGVHTAYGLPVDKAVFNDEIYRLDVVEDVLLGKGTHVPSPHTAISRLCIRMSYLHQVYGMARASYGVAMSNLKQPVIDLVLKHIRGPSVRVDSG